MAQRLGDYVFEWDPDKMTIPLRRKPTAVVPTYAGSATFQWTPLLAGSEIEIYWDWMPVDQYKALLLKYLSSETVEWNPETGGESYWVIVTDLSGEYEEVIKADFAYRRRVRMTLVIQSQASTTTTTTTTTTTSTTTTTGP